MDGTFRHRDEAEGPTLNDICLDTGTVLLL
jgi:hypothetical protein